jgi:hypothetical protein
MFWKLIIAAAIVLALSACSGSKEPVDLTGSWQSVNQDHENGVVMYALVSDGELEITWVADPTSHGLYWKGTVPDAVTPGDSFTSNGDTEAMDMSLLGSGSSAKEFKYASDQISFDLTAVGITQTIFMERV